MIQISRTADPYVVQVSFDYSEEIIANIKLLHWRQFNPETKTWIIKKGELKELVENLGIYNFMFQDRDLIKIAEGDVPKKEVPYIQAMDNRIWLTQSPKPYCYIVNFQYNQEYLAAVKSLKKRAYIPERKAWEISSDELFNLIMLLPDNTVASNDPNISGTINAAEIRAEAMKAQNSTGKADRPYLDMSLDRNGNMLLMSRMPVFSPKKSLKIDFCKYDVFLSKYVTYAYNIGRIAKTEGLHMIRADDMRTKAALDFYFMNPNVAERLKSVHLKYNHQFKTKPLPHQIEAFNYGIDFERLLIADEQGLGKTFTSINIAAYRHEIGQVHKCIIVCGVNSTKYNWQSEIEKHSNEKSVIFDMSGEDNKLKALNEWAENDVLFGIINIEALRYREPAHIPSPHYSDGRDETKDEKKERHKSESKLKYRYLCGKLTADKLPISPVTARINEIADMVVMDEIHKAKNASSLQGIALRQLTPRYRIGLSGTPMTNKAEDLWNILGWFGRNVYNYFDFNNRFDIIGGYKNIVGYRDLDLVNSQLKYFMLRRKKDEVIDLPDKVYETEYVEMTPRMKRQYKKIRSNIINSIKDAKKKKSDEREMNPLVQALRLRQLTSGVSIDSDESSCLKDDDNVKLIRVKEMLDESIIPSGGKAIIFSNYEMVTSIYKDALAEYHPAYIVGSVSPEDRQKETDRFQNDPDCHVIIGTIGAMGTGLTLNRAGYVFFIDKAWNETDNQQAEDRAHRIGTKNNVTIISMVCKNTIDEKIESKLAAKANLFSNVVDGKASDWTEKHYGSNVLHSSYELALDLLSEN